MTDLSSLDTSTPAPVPGPDTFSFEDYVAGKSTFPEFDHTVFIDQKRGVEWYGLTEQSEELEKEISDLGRRLEVIGQNTSGFDFVNAERDKIDTELEAALARKAAIDAERDVLAEEIKRSALHLDFRANTPLHLVEVTEAAEKEYEEKFGPRPDNAEAVGKYETNKGKWLLASQLAEYCTKVTTGGGIEIPKPTANGFIKLLDRLISSESLRLVNTIGIGLDSSAEWARRLDAGFLGRRADVAVQPVGASGAADGAQLGGSSADAADGRGDDVA